FNLVDVTGEVVGKGISSHTDIDVVSFTGSGASGKKITKTAKDTIKKTALERAGKSPTIILDDADIDEAAKSSAPNVNFNSGQVCTLASRTIIPESKKDEFINSVKEKIANYKVGSPEDEESALGPVISKDQYDRVQSYIQKGIDEGATLVTGGLGKP